MSRYLEIITKILLSYVIFHIICWILFDKIIILVLVLFSHRCCLHLTSLFALFLFLLRKLTSGAFTIDSPTPTLERNLNEHPIVQTGNTVFSLAYLNVKLEQHNLILEAYIDTIKCLIYSDVRSPRPTHIQKHHEYIIYQQKNILLNLRER
jgi:hypothetical protein